MKIASDDAFSRETIYLSPLLQVLYTYLLQQQNPTDNLKR